MKVTDKGFKKFTSDLKKIGKMKLVLGAVGDHGNGITNAELLRDHEFIAVSRTEGRGKNKTRRFEPARAPIRETIRSEKFVSGMKNIFIGLTKSNFNGKEINIKNVGEGMASFLENSVKETIMNKVTPDILESTKKSKARKKSMSSDTPLVDEGRMLRSIRAEAR